MRQAIALISTASGHATSVSLALIRPCFSWGDTINGEILMCRTRDGVSGSLASQRYGAPAHVVPAKRDPVIGVDSRGIGYASRTRLAVGIILR